MRLKSMDKRQQRKVKAKPRGRPADLDTVGCWRRADGAQRLLRCLLTGRQLQNGAARDPGARRKPLPPKRCRRRPPARAHAHAGPGG